MIGMTYASDGRDVRAVEWADVTNAPPSGSVITADFQRDGAWHLWTADGTEYVFESDASVSYTHLTRPTKRLGEITG